MRHTNKIIKGHRPVFGVAICGCRKEETIVPPVYGPLELRQEIPMRIRSGMYILNEGNMGSNKADIDFWTTARPPMPANARKRDWTVVKGLGERTGNDLQIYDGRLFAVINGSHKVEVMDASRQKKITR